MKPNSEPPSGRRCGPDPTAHGLDQAGADEQPDARPGHRPGAVGVAVEQLEEPLDRALGDARAVVQHADDDLVAARCRASTVTAVPRRRVLGRVAEQVAHDLLDVASLRRRRSAGPVGQARGRCVGSSDGLVGDDPLEQPARLERLGLDDEAAALDPAEDEQVLDEPMQPLRLRRGRPRAAPSARSGSSARPGRDRIWVRPRIVVIGVRSSWLMTSMNASRNSPARRSSAEQPVALLLDPAALGDVLAGPEHPRRACPSSSRKTRPAPCVQWTDAVRPDDPELEV